MSTQTIAIHEPKPATASDFHAAFIVAWAFCLLFYFMEYAVRSAPSVMLPELTNAFGLSTAGLSSLIGLYYYTYAIFAVIAGASVDRSIAGVGNTRFRLACCFWRSAPRCLPWAGNRPRLSVASCRVPAPPMPLLRLSISRPTGFRRGTSQPRSASPNASACSVGRLASLLRHR